MVKQIKLDKLDKNQKQGKVTKLAVNVGDTIAKGDKLMSIEGAKGATVIKSKFDGTVSAVAVEEGKQAKLGAVLVEVEVAE